MGVPLEREQISEKETGWTPNRNGKVRGTQVVCELWNIQHIENEWGLIEWDARSGWEERKRGMEEGRKRGRGEGGEGGEGAWHFRYVKFLGYLFFRYVEYSFSTYRIQVENITLLNLLIA